MSIMNFFKPAPPTAAPAASNQGGSQPPQQQGNQQGANNPKASVPNDANNPQTPADPLAPFAKMYDTPEAQDTAPQFNLDPTALSQAASSLSFLKGVDPEVMQKAQSGDTAALVQLMEASARNAYQTALSHSATLTGKFTEAREGFNAKNFSSNVRGELTVNALAGTQNFAHPVVRKELTRIAKEMQKQHPDAQPQEIAQMARDYLTELNTAIAPASAKQESQSTGPTDWDTFFDEQ